MRAPDWLASINGTACFRCTQARESVVQRHWCDELVAKDEGVPFPHACSCAGRHYH